MFASAVAKFLEDDFGGDDLALDSCEWCHALGHEDENWAALCFEFPGTARVGAHRAGAPAPLRTTARPAAQGSRARSRTVAMAASLRRQFVDTPLGQAHLVSAGLDTPPGDAASPPILLLHQTLRSTDEFAELLPLLASRGRAVAALDLPGYGASAPLPPGCIASVEAYARCAVAALDALGIRSALVAGVHLGAMVAVQLAAAHGARVAGVALLGPIVTDAAGRAALAPFFARHIQQPSNWRRAADGAHLEAMRVRWRAATQTTRICSTAC